MFGCTDYLQGVEFGSVKVQSDHGEEEDEVIDSKTNFWCNRE